MEHALSSVRRLSSGGKLSHAYLISGPSGSGRREMAKALSMAMVCRGEEKPCLCCPDCKKVLSGIHPDVTAVGPEEGKREILVDQIRALRTDAYIRPNEARRKVYLIDPAGAMNQNAQNALLKVLEEGPAYAAFLLLAEAEGQLLSTVRSRCEGIVLAPPAEESGEGSEKAKALADVLLSGTESALLAHCVGLEKLSREEWTGLLDAAVSELERRAREDLSLAGRILPLIEHMKTLRAACDFNVGSGHLAGWLCAGAFK